MKNYLSIKPFYWNKLLKHCNRGVAILLILIPSLLHAQTPVVSAFTPTSAATGTMVTITGTNFTGTSMVRFGGTAATSFTVVSATTITAIVAGGKSGDVAVTTVAGTGVKSGFFYLTLSGIITDFEGYWPSTTASNNNTNPDNSHSLLAFTFNGTTYSTGVNNATLTGQGINYTPGSYKSLPVANIAGTNTASSIYLAMASKVDGEANVANAAAVSGLTIRDVMTDGVNGLDMGTGITNLPTSALMRFDIHIINPAKINDPEPDILITQIAEPSTGNDVFQFVDAAGVTVGNTITQDMKLLSRLGTYKLDLFKLSPGAPFNSAMGFSAFSTNTTREIRMIGFTLADFGINITNYTQIAAIKITPSGTSDYAFISFNANAIELAPNISQNADKTNRSVCLGGTANLEVIATTAYGGALTYSWQQSIDGGANWTSVINGGNISGATTNRLTIVAPAHNHRYRSTVTESGTGNNSTSDDFIIAIVNPSPPTQVVVTATTTTCLNDLVSLSSAVTGGSNLFYQWQTNASGSYQAVNGAILRTFLPPVNATGVTSYQLVVSSGSGCAGSATSNPVVITVAGISGVTPASRCGSGVVSLAASATSGTISWYTVNTGGSPLTTGSAYAPSITATTTYYVATDGCAAGARVPVTATINNITWAGTQTTEWSTLANWDCGGVPPNNLPTSTNNITIPTAPTGGNFPTITGNAFVNNISVSQDASIIVANGGIFNIYGSISNLGSFTSTAGTIAMRGSAQQNIPANVFSNNTIKNLTINNTAGVLLGGELNLTGTYTPTAGVLTTFGHLTLKSTMEGTARVAPGSGTYILGNVNVERYIPEKRSWRLMTAPLTNSNTIYQGWQNGGEYSPGKGMLVTAPGGGPGIDRAGNASMKTWNPTLQVLQNVSNTLVAISPSVKGSADNKAYFVFVRGDRKEENIDYNGIKKNITTLTSTGYLQTGTQLFNGLSAVAGGFSLIGNPYASPVDLNLVLENSGTVNLKRKFYVWDPHLNQVGGYVSLDDVVTPGIFVPTPSFSTQGNMIQSGQAFFAITHAAGSATTEIKEANKAAAENLTIFGKPAGNIATLTSNLYLYDPADTVLIPADGLRVDFNQGFSAGVDDLDNIKCFNTNEMLGLVRNGRLLATERRPPVTGRDTLYFNLLQTSKRNYQFQINAAGFKEMGLVCMLEDSYTRRPVQLKMEGTTIVNFEINTDLASQANNRFRIVFMPSAPLPVTFTRITAKRIVVGAIVEWQVGNELNIARYMVQRSEDGVTFIDVDSTIAKRINNTTLAYEGKDHHPPLGALFYRVKSIDQEGAPQYSEIVKLAGAIEAGTISVYPNPVAGKLFQVKFVQQPPGNYNCTLTNTAGQVVMQASMIHAGGVSSQLLRLPPGTIAGNYQLRVKGENVETIIQLLVK